MLEIAAGEGEDGEEAREVPRWTQIPGNGWRMFSETGGGSGTTAARMRSRAGCALRNVGGCAESQLR